MRRKILITCAVVSALLVFAATLLALRHHPVPAMTVRHFKRKVSPVWGVSQMFAITNNRTSTCYYYGAEFQILEGNNWKTYRRLAVEHSPVAAVVNGALVPSNHLEPLKGTVYTLDNTDLPAGRQLRLKMVVSWELRGLDGALTRLKLRRYRSSVPLNPFDTTSAVFSQPIEITSEEFVEPKPRTK
jgi:hypothetical protein